MKDATLNRLFLRFRDKGDGKALAAVFDVTARELLAVAGHLVARPEEAEDVVQLVFLRAIDPNSKWVARLIQNPEVALQDKTNGRSVLLIGDNWIINCSSDEVACERIQGVTGGELIISTP